MSEEGGENSSTGMIRPDRVLRKEDAYYSKVEQQIGVVKGLWNEASSFTPPSPNDTVEDISRDEHRLRGVFAEASNIFPDTDLLFHKYKDLKDKSSKRSIPKNERDDAMIAAGQLESKPGVSFLLQLESGIENLLKRREQIRNIYVEMGENWKNPDSYVPKVKINTNMGVGDFLEVVPSNFSISLIAKQSSYDSEVADGRITDGVLGMHFTGTPFNLIKASEGTREEKLLHAIFNTPIPLYSPMILKHEDFHAFADAFSILKGDSSTSSSVVSSIKGLGRLKVFAAPEVMYNQRRDNILRTLSKLVDGNDELQAEIASVPRNSWDHLQIPNHTFRGYIKSQLAALKEAKGIDPEIDQAIELISETMNAGKIREKIQEFYKKVKEESPDKLDDLDIALALFRPSQYDHVENLVNRWTKN